MKIHERERERKKEGDSRVFTHAESKFNCETKHLSHGHLKTCLFFFFKSYTWLVKLDFIFARTLLEIFLGNFRKRLKAYLIRNNKICINNVIQVR